MDNGIRARVNDMSGCHERENDERVCVILRKIIIAQKGRPSDIIINYSQQIASTLCKHVSIIFARGENSNHDVPRMNARVNDREVSMWESC